MLFLRRTIPVANRGLNTLLKDARGSESAYRIGARAAGLLAVATVGVYVSSTETSSCAKSDPNALEIPKSKEGLIFSTLLRKRAIFLSGSITEESAKTLVAQLLFLEMDQPGVPITMYITSGGGLVYAGLAIYDVMKHITSPVHTVCVGHAESMAAILLASGEPGFRTALPHGRIMLHQPSLGVSRTTAQDVMIQAVEGEKTKLRLVELLSEHTRKSTKDVADAIERNNYMGVEEAMEFGLIDSIAVKMQPTLGGNGSSSVPPVVKINSLKSTAPPAAPPVVGTGVDSDSGVRIFKR